MLPIQTRRPRTEQRARLDRELEKRLAAAVNASSILQAEGWPWYEQKLLAREDAFERMLREPGIDPREADVLRGRLAELEQLRTELPNLQRSYEKFQHAVQSGQVPASVMASLNNIASRREQEYPA